MWLFFLYAIVTAGLDTILLVLIIPTWFTLAIALTPLIAAIFYRLLKSGLVMVVREGVNVYCFTDRTRLGAANELASRASELRDIRLAVLRTSTPRDVTPRTARTAGRAGAGVMTADPSDGAADVARRSRAMIRTTTASAVVLASASIRLVGVTRPYRTDGFSLWDLDSRLIWVLPAAVSAAAALLALTVRVQRYRGAATMAAVGAALIVGLQVLFDLGVDLTAGLDEVSTGFWLVQIGGAETLFAGIALASRRGSARLVAFGRLAWDQIFDDRMMILVVLGGFVTTLGAITPWIEDSGFDVFWGFAPELNSLYGAFFAASVVMCIFVPVVAVAMPQRMTRGGFLAGWSAGLGGWALGFDLPADDLAFGFRTFEVGVVLTAVAAVLLLMPVRRTPAGRSAPTVRTCWRFKTPTNRSSGNRSRRPTPHHSSRARRPRPTGPKPHRQARHGCDALT